MITDKQTEYRLLKSGPNFKCPTCKNISGQFKHMTFDKKHNTRFHINCIVCGENMQKVIEYQDIRGVFYINPDDIFIRIFLLGMAFPAECFKTEAEHKKYRDILAMLHRDISGRQGRKWQRYYNKLIKKGEPKYGSHKR